MATTGSRMDMFDFLYGPILQTLISKVQELHAGKEVQAQAWSRRGLETVYNALYNAKRLLPFKWTVYDRKLVEAIQDHLAHLYSGEQRPMLQHLLQGAKHLLDHNVLAKLDFALFLRDKEHTFGGKRRRASKSKTPRRRASKSKTPRRRSVSRRR